MERPANDDDVAERQGPPDAATSTRQLRAIFDGYGLPRARRSELVDRMVVVAVHSARTQAVLAHVCPENTEAVSPGRLPGAVGRYLGRP